MGIGNDQSSVRSWLVQKIIEFSYAARRCAGRGCALIRQLANMLLLGCISLERDKLLFYFLNLSLTVSYCLLNFVSYMYRFGITWLHRKYVSTDVAAVLKNVIFS